MVGILGLLKTYKVQIPLNEDLDFYNQSLRKVRTKLNEVIYHNDFHKSPIYSKLIVIESVLLQCINLLESDEKQSFSNKSFKELCELLKKFGLKYALNSNKGYKTLLFKDKHNDTMAKIDYYQGSDNVLLLIELSIGIDIFKFWSGSIPKNGFIKDNLKDKDYQNKINDAIKFLRSKKK